MFALLVPSCCNKSGTSCYHLLTRLMAVTDLLQVVPTRLIQLFVTSCYELVVIKLLTICYGQTTAPLLEQLVASLLASSSQPCYKMITTCSRLVNICEHILLTSCVIFTRVNLLSELIWIRFSKTLPLCPFVPPLQSRL